jgi:hypothetical protein
MDENLPNKVDHLFNKGLQKFKTEPSEAIWAKIEEGLNREDRKIGGISIKWRRYAVAVGVLMVGLGFLFKIYFLQEANFNREAVPRSKAENSLARYPKTIPPEGYQKGGNIILTPLVHVTKVKTAKYEVGTGKPPDNGSRINYPVVGRTLEDLIMSMVQVIPTQAIESPLLPGPLNQRILPGDENTNRPLSVIHPKERFRDRLSVTPYFSKEFVGYTLTDNDLTGINGQEIEEQERNVFSAAVGFYINYKINKRWVFQSGISYSWSNSNIDSATSYAVVDNHGTIQYKLNTISGYGYLLPSSSVQPNVGDSVYTAKSYSQLHYITIPLVLSYHVPLGRFSLLMGAGASVNVLTSAEIETKTYGNGVPEKEYSVDMMGLKKVNYGVIVKFDLEYRINSNLGINIIPCFKNTLSPINLEGAISAYPYNFGIGVGFTYRF